MDLPSGVLTFVFCDVEASAPLARARSDRYGEGFGELLRLLRRILVAAGGLEIDAHGGEEVFSVFAAPGDALAGAAEAQRAAAELSWPGGGRAGLRMGVHTGEPVVLPFGYTGEVVHHAARLCHAAHGGQVLVSQATHDALAPGSGVELRELGRYDPGGQRLFQLVAPGLGDGFQPPRGIALRDGR